MSRLEVRLRASRLAFQFMGPQNEESTRAFGLILNISNMYLCIYIYKYVHTYTLYIVLRSDDLFVEPSLEIGAVAYITMTVSDIDVVEGMLYF